MKMAKASERDIEVAGDIMSILSQLDRGDYPVISEEEDRPDFFDPEDFEHLKHFYNLVANSLEKAPGWHGRVIGGMCYVVLFEKNEIVDPDADVLELHPKIAKALTDSKRYDYVVENMVVMSETGSRAFVGREEIEPYVDSALAAKALTNETVAA